ncbi:MAG: hypothetical protein RLN76_10025 [Phycisphaeraceae bacterium]
MNTTLKSAIAMTTLMIATAPAMAYFQGFEDPAFAPGDPNDWNNFTGTITRATSGTAGITSATGVAHATVSADSSGPFTRLGGYSSTFGPGFTASLDVYLDTSWVNGQGFDYSVAVNNQAGDHLRDFIWHVGVDSGSLLVNASNNTDFAFNAFKLNNENGGNNYTVASTGWYTFEQVFYDNAGALAVDFNLLDNLGNTLYSITRSTPTDLIASVVGGNRYGWMTYNNIDGLAVDNTSLSANGTVIPTPAAFGAGLIGLSLVALRRRSA